jgi:NADP-dependent 3-hydroxy acid dehydrogenase YdfG
VSRIQQTVCWPTGIGASIAIAFAQAGAQIILAQRDVNNTKTRDEIVAGGGTCDIVPCDLADREDASKVVDRALAIVDHLDILVNNGGMLQRADSVDVKVEEWDYVSDFIEYVRSLLTLGPERELEFALCNLSSRRKTLYP